VWLVNLPGDQIETYRDPGTGGYASERRAKRENASILSGFRA